MGRLRFEFHLREGKLRGKKDFGYTLERKSKSEEKLKLSSVSLKNESGKKEKDISMDGFIIRLSNFANFFYLQGAPMWRKNFKLR
jgi:hypothetical protein